MQLKEYDSLLAKHDWYYNYSDDYSVWATGDRNYEHLREISKLSDQHLKLFQAWGRLYFSGEPFETPVFSRDDLNRVRDSVLRTRDAKPVVWYSGKPEFHQAVGDDGEPWVYARVYAINHPKLGTGYIRTSMILTEPKDEGFETRNTIYKFVDDSGIGG